MIQIDDSGYGCPIGSTILGAFRTETGEFRWKALPIETHQGGAFQRKEYLDAARDVTFHLLAELESSEDEPIEICSGYIHGRTRLKLALSQRPWRIVQIKGPLQTLIEAALGDYLRSLGFEYNRSTEKYGSLFLEAIKWLKGGDLNRRGMDPQRKALAKTGWATFHLYEELPYWEATQAAKRFKAQRRRDRWRNRDDGDE